MSLILFLSAVTLASLIIGSACSSLLRSSGAKAMYPLVGLSIIVLVCSSCFLLQVPAAIISGLLTCVLVVSAKVALKNGVWDFAFGPLPAFFLAVSLLVLPYFLRFGGSDVITGYHTSNDAVIHALLSRGVEGNGAIAEKLYRPGSLLSYPLGAHSLIYLGHSLLDLDTRQSVFAFGLLYLAFSVFPLRMLLLNRRDKRSPRLVADCCAAFGAATYYNCTIGYHGFLPQVGYVPFALSCLVLLFTDVNERNVRGWPQTVLAALCGAAALSLYSFASMIVIGVGVLVVPKGLGWANHARLIGIFGLVTLVALGANLGHIGTVLRGLIAPLFGGGGASDLAGQSSSFGNLVGYLDPRIWTGIWWEVDYRFQNLQRLSSHLFGLIAAFGIGLVAYAIKSNDYGALLGRRLVATGVIAYLLVVLVTHSPYSAGKISSFLAPVVSTLLLRGAISLAIRQVYGALFAAALGALMISSNAKMIRHIAALPGAVIEAMRELAADYSGKRLLVFSGNDWLLYTLDRKDVDIVGLHYLPDPPPVAREAVDYAAVVFEGSDQRKQNYNCIREVRYDSFLVCETH